MAEINPPDDDTRQRLLDAAGPIFARRGFDKATVREICADAGVNIASVGYYFGDKLGLYLAVVRLIRSRREQAFPMPVLAGPPEERLLVQVHTMLRRMLACDDSGWEAQLMMREMHQPTAAFREMVEEYFRPLFEKLQATLVDLSPQPLAVHQAEQLALSVVGQCLYYRVGSEVIQQLIPAQRREEEYSTASLARHITAFTLASLSSGAYFEYLQRSIESPTHE